MALSVREVSALAVCIIFPWLYTRGPSSVSYYTKYAIYYVSLTLSTTICLPLTLFRPRDTRNMLFGKYFLKATTKLLGLQWTLNNISKAQKLLGSSSGPSVLVINHQSSLDVIGMVTELWPLMEGKGIWDYLNIRVPHMTTICYKMLVDFCEKKILSGQVKFVH